ncbi:hypothetical protein JOF53_008415 [Crossiella equi]|uniref:Uncharacterized protein n=1 Tax=Crossiella equi TaxID=130796 RepID=A0ABS5ASI3_9PSEU|nr:hypothetical protein [Crossiella equi]MBP2479543.1 hypothetical protein [Crossiella equi]
MMNETNTARPQSYGRAALWAALVVSAMANAGTSIAGLSPYVSVAFGALTLMFGLALFTGRRAKR